MGHVVSTPAGSFRANWRDPTGRQRAQTFSTKRAAREHLARMESAMAAGSYVDPHGGRIALIEYAERWAMGHQGERTTRSRDASILRVHVLPRWGDWPLRHIDHLSVQQWVSELAETRSPATVRECVRMLRLILASAVRDRLIPHDPTEGVKVPRRQRADRTEIPLTRTQLRTVLLPAVTPRYRFLVALAAGCGLRWGEAMGLAMDMVDPDARRLRVSRVIEEVDGQLRLKPYPKSESGRRTVPLPPLVLEVLAEHQEMVNPARWNGVDLVSSTTAGTPLSRSVFRQRVWRPALVRAGLLGTLVELPSGGVRAEWSDRTGQDVGGIFPTRQAAEAELVQRAAGGLRFHDLRHAYATWLISDGVPVNVVQRVMGHSSASTTLNLYVHASSDHDDAVRAILG
ncbi:tyrosine-type recombinase/integrase [Jannaschia sp. R86511]|uniref:tyrosine-type recombinase/integrase n=1 Tax=Jannaschia sp. R86511 TaxID=3093853 RepID=UPI0036D31E08